MTRDRDDLPDSLADLERRLAGWVPAPATDASDRDRLLFAAGAQAGRQQARRQAAFLGLALLVGLGGWNLREQQARARLEVALRTEQARTAALMAAPPPQPVTTLVDYRPIEPPDPSSVLALARRFARDDFARLDPAPALPVGSIPADPAVPILTPRSRPGAVDPLTL